MKLTVSQLRKIIKEEVARTLREAAGEVKFKGDPKTLSDFKTQLDNAEAAATRGRGKSMGVANMEDGQLVVRGDEAQLNAAKDASGKLGLQIV